MKTIRIINIAAVFALLVFGGCRKKAFVPFAENVQEGVMVYFEVTEKTPQEVSDFYYGALRDNLGLYSGLDLPERIERPWAFGFLGFNPINGEMKFVIVTGEEYPEMIECEKDAVENIVIFRDDLNREIGGYSVIGAKAYVYSGSSSYSVLKSVSENDNPFYRSENFQELSRIYTNDDWVRIFVPGSVFALLVMVPAEFKPDFLVDVRSESVKGFSARLSGKNALFFEALTLVDTGTVSAQISFSGWEPQRVHGSIARKFFWNLL